MEARLTRFCLGQKKQNAMNAIKKTIAVLFLAAIPFLSSAQKSKIPQRNEIITVTSGEEGVEETLEVFNMPEGDKNNYFLSVGHLGFGSFRPDLRTVHSPWRNSRRGPGNPS